MSSEAAGTPVEGLRETVHLRRSAFRIAFGVTGAFALAEALNWDFTFLGPMLAAQSLVKLRRPPTAAQGFAFILVIAITNGIVLLLATSLVGAPAVLLLALGLLLMCAYYAQFRGAPEVVTLLFQIALVTIPVFAVVSPSTASSFTATLLQAGIVALCAVWAAFAIFPATDDRMTAPQTRALAPLAPAVAGRAALRNTLIIMPMLTWYVLDVAQIAVVSLITMVTILRQDDPRQGGLVAAALLLGNIVGGLSAALAYNLILLADTFSFFVLICLIVTLLLAGRIVMSGRQAPILAVALATFILLLGLGLSPVPGGSTEAFLGRLINMLAAAAYTVGALSVLPATRDLVPA
jgi:Protein of unknown function (DUF2955)